MDSMTKVVGDQRRGVASAVRRLAQRRPGLERAGYELVDYRPAELTVLDELHPELA